MLDTESTVLDITDAAVAKLRGHLSTVTSPQAGVRVVVQAQGCAGFAYGLMIDDAPTGEDQVLRSNGLTVYVDAPSVDMIRGARIDYVDTEHGAGFTIDNPNQAPGCRCGGHEAGAVHGEEHADGACRCGGHGAGGGCGGHGAEGQHGEGHAGGACGCGGHAHES